MCSASQIFGTDEITCGNVYSTLWHVTAYSDSNTPLAGDMDYAICSGAAGLSYCPNPSGSWNLAQAQPFSGITPPPGFQLIFGNPKLTQTVVQPAGTTFFWLGNGTGTNQGTVDFTGIRVVGLSGLGINATQLFGNPLCSSPPSTNGVLTWNGTNFSLRRSSVRMRSRVEMFTPPCGTKLWSTKWSTIIAE